MSTPSPNQIIVRADGNETIGMGHLLRCFSLARQLRRRGLDVSFASRPFGPAVASIQKAGFQLHAIPLDLPLEAEARWLLLLMKRTAARMLITDLRELPSGFLTTLRESGCFLAVIDEWGDKPIDADFLFNGTIVEHWHRYRTQGRVELFLGGDYALLDDSFPDYHERPRLIQKEARRILIALGGDDPFCLTLKTLRAIELIQKPLDVTVIIGPAFTDENHIRAAASSSRHATTVVQNTPEMAKHMAQADLAITGGGLTALETACTGTPALILCEVDHQIETAVSLERHEAGINLGLGVPLAESSIHRSILELLDNPERRNRLSQAGKKLIDGRGTGRVCEILTAALASGITT